MTIQERIEEWARMMRGFPSDGWDGAAQLIAEHDARVRDMERKMDEECPEWRDLHLRFSPRSRRLS